MTLAVLENPENTYAEQIGSMRDWWNLAGVDLHYNSEPASLLAQAKIEQSVKLAPPESMEAASLTESGQQSGHEAAVHKQTSENYPAQYDEFIDWLSTPGNLVEAEWSRQYVLPTGAIEPEIMIVVAMPDQEGLARNALFSEQCSVLLANMLRAIGCDSANTYSAPISLARSFDGRIDLQYHDILKKRMLHLIGLVKPKNIIIFGETPSHLFFGENLLTARKSLQFINHFSFKTEAIATFHPRILNERPEFKAEAWKDLQLLSGGHRI